MLEALFAHQSQVQAFWAFAVCGLALGLCIHVGSLVHRGSFRAVWDVGTALLFAAAAFMVLLHFGAGLRAYALLGVLLGALLYLAGWAPLLQRLAGFLQKYKNSHPPKAGNTAPRDESTVQKDAKE